MIVDVSRNINTVMEYLYELMILSSKVSFSSMQPLESLRPEINAGIAALKNLKDLIEYRNSLVGKK